MTADVLAEVSNLFPRMEPPLQEHSNVEEILDQDIPSFEDLIHQPAPEVANKLLAQSEELLERVRCNIPQYSLHY